jgi:hypothetical protein
MGAEAWRKIEGTEQERAPRSAARRRRSEADTMPASDPFARVAAGRPEWCVDVGDALLTMTTFELWTALERSDVEPWMRVWREGMECWTAAGELPELALAIATTPRPAPAPRPVVSAATREPAPPAPARAPERPANDAPARAARAVLREPSWASLPEITPAPVTVRSPPDPRGTRWVALGSAIAVAALGVALGGSGLPSSPPEHAAHAAAGAPLAIEPAPAETASAAPPVPSPPPVERPPVRRDERGQRRLPRGGRRPHGL